MGAHNVLCVAYIATLLIPVGLKRGGSRAGAAGGGGSRREGGGRLYDTTGVSIVLRDDHSDSSSKELLMSVHVYCDVNNA